MTNLKPLIFSVAFISLPIAGYYSASASMENTNFDDSFYQNLFISNNPAKSENELKEGIDFDDLNVRDYFFNNSLNLIWKNKNKSESHEPISSNAFLLNVLLPDWITQYHSDYGNYVPKKNYGGDEVVLLLGAPFSFASKLFNKDINDWKSSVNESSSPVLLSEKSNEASTHELLFSHPWPSQDTSIRFSQNHIYTLENDKFTTFYSDFQKPYFFSIEPKNVDLVYAAVDLSINSELLHLDIRKNIQSLEDLKKLHKSSQKVNWIQEISSPTGEKYKFFVDFSVIKVHFPIANLNQKFLDYLIDVYRKKEVLPSVLNSSLPIKDNRVGPVYLGGWSSLSAHDTDIHTMDNLLLKVDPKTSVDITSKTSSECSSDPKTCFDFKLYETYSSRFSNENSERSTTYSAEDISCVPNNLDGILFCKYRIKNSGSGVFTKNNKEIIISGFKAISPSPQSDFLKNYHEEQFLHDSKLINFLDAKPKARAKWQEYRVNSSYLSFQNLHNYFLSRLLLRDSGFSQIGDSKNYFNISHYLEIPNLSLNNSKGMVTVMKNPHASNIVLLGMYDGEKTWKNPISGFHKNIGKIIMFLSPFRYDLFNSENNLSKPSLGDVLKKRKLSSKLIQTNRFRV